MPSWNSRGLRGSTLEELINRTIEKYRESGLCLIQKIPTPITPIKIDKENRHITLAYFEQKSTVDYIGAVQGIPICFDAKECIKDTFSLQNIHKHQVQFMEEFEKQGGISFILIYYASKNEFYYLTYQKLREFWDRMLSGGRKSFRYDELDKKFLFISGNGVFVPFLEVLQIDLDLRD
ncbi:recombination protein U [Lachnotalea glycerini]|jgi:recombination protein U|uniref:Holliday junction resolvase RecU n=1 Tax=Lachnotalea glycerini TaxID=1763509 RepID=A0A255IHW8_9FIRM|nr:Holliday junction resolvase RecU [Lachnotalea glycerini]PXV95439.1 recombination protein U [Lachnotalea glycerini]RDY32759.1 Holliday junction resolvase RecU [Lachnotalea glycerini]